MTFRELERIASNPDSLVRRRFPDRAIVNGWEWGRRRLVAWLHGSIPAYWKPGPTLRGPEPAWRFPGGFYRRLQNTLASERGISLEIGGK